MTRFNIPPRQSPERPGSPAVRSVRRWESVVLVGAIGTAVGIVVALLQPIFAPWRGLWHWLGGVFIMPSPLILLFVVGIVGLHFAVRRRERESK